MNFLDRVRETFTSTGTGTLNLDGAATGFRTFVAAMGGGGTVFYFAQGAPAGADANNWEFGYGTLTDASPDTLSRTLLASSTGSLISWAAGTKHIMSTPIASILMGWARPYRGTARPGWLPAGGLWLDTDASPFPRLYHYDGTNDIALFDIDETNNRVYPMDATGAGIGGAEVDVASAASCDVFAGAADNVRITGNTGPITALAGASVVAGPRRYVRFASTPTLTHHATALIIPGGANIVAAAGDRMIVKSLGSGNVEVVEYVKASGLPAARDVVSQAEAEAGAATTPRDWTAERVKQAIAALAVSKVLQQQSNTYATYTSTSTAVPLDDTPPLDTEGATTASVAITLANAANSVHVVADFQGYTNGSEEAVMSIFRGSTLLSTKIFGRPTSGHFSLAANIVDTPGSVGPHTYKIVVGPSASGTLYINGNNTTRQHGGGQKSSITATEIAA